MKKAIKNKLAKNRIIYKLVMSLNNYIKGIYYWDFDVLDTYVAYKMILNLSKLEPTTVSAVIQFMIILRNTNGMVC